MEEAVDRLVTMFKQGLILPHTMPTSMPDPLNIHLDEVGVKRIDERFVQHQAQLLTACAKLHDTPLEKIEAFVKSMKQDTLQI
jgi:hypothetical protein